MSDAANISARRQEALRNDNLPILYKNVLDGLRGQFAKNVFLWATDKFQFDRYCYKAEAFAREADNAVRASRALIDLRQRVTLRDGGLLLNEHQESDLLKFIQARFANYRLGGNIKSPMPELERAAPTAPAALSGASLRDTPDGPTRPLQEGDA